MMMDNAIEIKVPAPDSQYRLLPCRCCSDNVAYVRYAAQGEELWRVQCFDCGNTGKGARVRHDAQVAWNKAVNQSG